MSPVTYNHVPGDEVFVVSEFDQSIFKATVLRVRIVVYTTAGVADVLVEYLVELDNDTSDLSSEDNTFSDINLALDYLQGVVAPSPTPTPTVTPTPSPSATP